MKHNQNTLFLIKEFSEARALKLTFELFTKAVKLPSNWYFLETPINKDFKDKNTLRSFLPREIKNATLMKDQNNTFKIGFKNKIDYEGAFKAHVNLNYYEVAACIGRSVIDQELKLRKRKKVVISNAKISQDNVQLLNRVLNKLLENTTYEIYIIPRHILPTETVHQILHDDRVVILNKIGVLVNVLAKADLVIHGNVFMFDDSEHNPYESSLNSNVWANKKYCKKTEYKWLYDDSGLIQYHDFDLDTFNRVVSTMMEDPKLQKKLTVKELQIQKNRLVYIGKLKEILCFRDYL